MEKVFKEIVKDKQVFHFTYVNLPIFYCVDYFALISVIACMRNKSGVARKLHFLGAFTGKGVLRNNLKLKGRGGNFEGRGWNHGSHFEK